MLNPRLYENSRADGFPVLEIIDTRDRDSEEPAQPATFVPLRRTELAGEISGPVAAMVLTQRFGFGTQQAAEPIEAVYRFPLPGDAAVTGVCVYFGDVEIRAELAERTAAEASYQEARAEGRQAALLTRESPDVFTLQIAGLKAGEDIVIQTSYAQLARPEGEGWSLRVPLTTAPRFVRSDERGSHHADGQPLALLRDPGHTFALDLTIEGTHTLTSPTHDLDVGTGSEGRLRVRLRDGDILPDRDCVLFWQPHREASHPTLQILRHADPVEREACFLALVSPPAVGPEMPPTPTLPREVILLIDHSGSMSGPKWAAADWAVQNLLAGLTPSDTFNLGLFHDTTQWFGRSPVRADDRTLKLAREFLLANKDSGGTELGVALEQALSQPRDQARRARHVLIVTDAQVSDSGRLLDLVEREWSRSGRRRIGVLCIDAAPNSGLANELAERGGGLARFLTSDPAENDIATALDDVLADWAAPVLRGLTLEIDHPDVEAAGRRVSHPRDGVSAIDLGDLPAGRAIWMSGRLSGYRGEARTFRLLATDRGEVAREQPDTAASATRPAIAALFGARRVLELELASTSAVGLERRLRQLGYDPDQVLGRTRGAPGEPAPVYAENARSQAAGSVRAILVREALHYGIACSETAFVATRSEAGQRVGGTVAVANALPHGWSSDFLMPRMALQAQAFGGAMPIAPAPMPTGMMAPSAPGQSAGSSGPGFDLGSIADAATGMFSRLRARATPSARPPRSTGQSAESVAPAATRGLTVLFSGTPVFAGQEALLFDSASSPMALPAGSTLSRLAIRFLDGVSDSPVDRGLTLLIYVDDPMSPRARVRLADLLRQGGERPLNVRRQAGQVIRVVLQDANGAWASSAQRLEVRLG
jgi:Ca-activated chloride channel family protein